MVTGDTWRLQIGWAYEQQWALNVHYLRQLSITGAGATNQEIIQVLENDIYALTKTWNSAAHKFLFADMVCVYGVQVGQQAFSNLLAGTGGDMGGADGFAPKQVAGLITKRHSMAVRGNRGRTYCGFLTQTDTVGGVATVGLQAKMQNYADLLSLGTTIVGAGGTSSLRFGLWPRGNPSTFRLIDSCVVSPFLATQRRRSDFGRTNP